MIKAIVSWIISILLLIWLSADDPLMDGWNAYMIAVVALAIAFYHAGMYSERSRS